MASGLTTTAKQLIKDIKKQAGSSLGGGITDATAPAPGKTLPKIVDIVLNIWDHRPPNFHDNWQDKPEIVDGSIDPRKTLTETQLRYLVPKEDDWRRSALNGDLIGNNLYEFYQTGDDCLRDYVHHPQPDLTLGYKRATFNNTSFAHVCEMLDIDWMNPEKGGNYGGYIYTDEEENIRIHVDRNSGKTNYSHYLKLEAEDKCSFTKAAKLIYEAGAGNEPAHSGY